MQYAEQTTGPPGRRIEAHKYEYIEQGKEPTTERIQNETPYVGQGAVARNERASQIRQTETGQPESGTGL